MTFPLSCFYLYLGVGLSRYKRSLNAAEAEPNNIRLQSFLQRAGMAKEIAESDLNRGPFLYPGYSEELDDIRDASSRLYGAWQHAGVNLIKAEGNVVNAFSALKNSLSQPGSHPQSKQIRG